MTAIPLTHTLNLRHRFPLIYMFLILVGAAFLAGSISIGGDLMRTSYIKEVASDAERYESLYKQFQLSYQALPGDMENASTFWPNCRNDLAECNGNGDGNITSPMGDKTPEAALVWKHFSVSGMVTEQFSGDLISGYYVPGATIPQAPYVDSGYLITQRVSYYLPQHQGAHYLKVGKLANWKFEEPTVTLADAAALDSKFDDGIANSGKILSHSSSAEGCLSNYNREVLIGKQIAHYALNLEQEAFCSVYFKL